MTLGFIELRANPPEIVEHVPRRLVAHIGIFLERLADDHVHVRGDRVVQPGDGRRRVVEDGVHDFAEGPSLERQPAGEHLVDHDAG